MKNLLLFLLFIVLICLSISCSTGGVDNTNANSSIVKVSPSPKPTLTDEETKANSEKKQLEQTQAISDFLAKHYKGWKLQGVANESSANCDEYSACNLHLVKGTQTKVITVMLKEFTRQDSSTYWLVFEARQFDLAQVKVEEIKEREREYVLETLTIDDIDESLREAIYEREREALADLVESYEPPDPY